jgi:hypothetical protein
MSLDSFSDPAPPWRVRSVSALLALGLLLPVLAGCKKQAEAPPVTNEAQLRAVTEQGMQRMMQDQQRGQGALPPGPPSK